MKIPLRAYGELLASYLRPQWRRAALLAVMLFGGIGLQLVSPQITRRFIDLAQASAASATLLRLALAFIGVALLQQVVSLSATYLSEDIGWTATNGLRADLAHHCLRLDMSFHNAHTPGEMIERIDGDVTALSSFFSQFVIQVVGNAFFLLGVMALLFREDWRVGLTLSLFSLLALGAIAGLRNLAIPHWAAERQASADLFGFLEERLAGTEDIRSCGAKTYVMRRFFELMRALMQRNLKAGLMVNWMLNATFLLMALGNALALGVGAWLYLAQTITVGTVFMVFEYSMMLERPISAITRQLGELQRAGAGIARIRELLALRSQVQEHQPAQGRWPSLSAGPLAVEFRDVTFGYHDAMPKAGGTHPPAPSPEPAPDLRDAEIVLRDLSFRLEPGRVLGLLGRTGSGKTTITRLLFRLYDPDRGTVRLGAGDRDSGALDLRDLPIAEVRGKVGMVTQTIELFNATVRDNLTLFNPAIPDERIVNALGELGLAGWLEGLSQGLDTELESGGGGLSAGEAQLLAFTRIFLQDPGLVILYEASSRLDPATERLIERAVSHLAQGRTAIIIAHWLGTVQRADEIMILDQGRIVEHGERAALAADPASRFSHLLQTGLEEVLA